MAIYQYIDLSKGQTTITGTNYFNIRRRNNIQSYNDGYCTANLIHGTLSNLPDTFCISFYECIPGGNAIIIDWNHIFSFGTHNSDGGDNPYYPLAILNTRDNIYGCSLSSALGSRENAMAAVAQWHLWQIYVHDNTVDYYMDSSLLKSGVNSSKSNMTNMYLNGRGSGGTMTSDISFISISSSLTIKSIFNLKEDKDKNYYGILKS